MTEVRRDRRAERHAATRREILDAAWELARERGLGGWSLRDVASAVGMRAPSLYGYFDSKNALYDALFAEGNAELLARAGRAHAELTARGAAPAEILRAAATLFFDFAVEDPARFQLLFLRTVPGFEPSEAAYSLARQTLSTLADVLAAGGAGSPEQVDLWTAMVTGLATQQASNDPGGNRWRRLLGPAADMFAAVHLPAAPRSGPD
ncbi:MAG TPA: TetR/AcrR family transcriptional regulator [Blastococcus sp.]|nr:TetR/AcrR family transcriptional regulator [Blastococcus sp.]